MSELAIGIFILIIPGIISLIIISHLVIHRKWEPFFYSLYSIILGIISYVTMQLVSWLLDLIIGIFFKIPILFSSLSVWDLSLLKSMQFNVIEIFLACLASVPLALLVSYTVNNKFFHSSAAKTGITMKYGDESLFYYFLNTKQVDWVYVRDIERDLVFEGRVKSYSEDDKKQEIVLICVTVYTYYEPIKLYETESIYLSREHGKFHIEQIPKDAFSPKEQTNG